MTGNPGDLGKLYLILGFYTVAFLKMGSSERFTVLPDGGEGALTKEMTAWKEGLVWGIGIRREGDLLHI